MLVIRFRNDNVTEILTAGHLRSRSFPSCEGHRVSLPFCDGLNSILRLKGREQTQIERRTALSQNAVAGIFRDFGSIDPGSTTLTIGEHFSGGRGSLLEIVQWESVERLFRS